MRSAGCGFLRALVIGFEGSKVRVKTKSPENIEALGSNIPE